MKKIYCKVQECLACRSCELACAAAHSETKDIGQAIRDKTLADPRIRVEYVDEKGSLQRVRAIAVQCRQCEEALCEQACIAGGIHRDKETGDMVVSLEKCVGCWSCIMVCPVGAITKDELSHHIVKCDHCPGEDTPVCILACPTGALEYREQNEAEKEKL